MRKGQITIFVIIGLVLLVLIMIFFAFKDSIIEQAGKVGIVRGLAMTQEAIKVQSDLAGCVKGVAEEGVILMGVQGGYAVFDSRVKHTDKQTTQDFIPYFGTVSSYLDENASYAGTAYSYFEGKNLVPTKKLIEQQLASFVTRNMEKCKRRYTDIDVTYGDVNTLAVIRDEKISLKLDMDVKVKKGGTESGFKNFNTDLPVRLGTVQNILSRLVEKQIKTGAGQVCLTCASDVLAAEEDVQVKMYRVGGDVFFSLTDKKSKIGDYGYTFVSAGKF